MQEKEPYDYQVTSKMPKDLVEKIDKICSSKLQARGAWIRQTILEKVIEEEKATETKKCCGGNKCKSSGFVPNRKEENK